MKAQINPKQSQQFILAGNALITVKSLRTNKHFTYRIKKKKNASIWFVSVAYNGGDRQFNYIGCILADNTFKHTKASQVKQSTDSFIAFNWAWNNLSSEQIELWHEGHCGRCGRTLTEPESIKLGYGPVCKSLIN